MGAAVDINRIIRLLNAQPVGTDLLYFGFEYELYRKRPNGLWYQPEADSVFTTQAFARTVNSWVLL